MGSLSVLNRLPTGNRSDDRRAKTIDKTDSRWNLLSRSDASVAQLAEQLTLNQLVEGSSPSRGTTLPTKADVFKPERLELRRRA